MPLVCGALSLGTFSCQKPSVSTTAAINSFHPYTIEHAILHFEYFGDTRGTEDLFIDSFGRLEAHSVHSEHIVEGRFKPTINYAIKHLANATIIDSVRRQRVNMTDPTMDSIYHLAEADVPSPEKVFQGFSSNTGVHKIGTATKAGLTVNTWQDRDLPTYLYEWRGVLVGRQTGSGEHGNELRLMSIDTVTPIDRSRFEVRSDYPVVDMQTNSAAGGASPEPPPIGQAPKF